MDDAEESFINGAAYAPPLLPPPSIVSLANFTPSISPSPRRLSSHFNEPTRPIHSARRLSWVSLQGRLVGAEEASSAKEIGGVLSRDEALAWELFSPIHRILIVAIIAVATADLKKSRQILSLRRSVDLRDQVLLSMQQKLDDLCEQVNYMKDQPENLSDISLTKNGEFQLTKDTQYNKTKHSSCGCCLCEQHQPDTFEKPSVGDEMFKFKMPVLVTAEQEERRMSDLSDWASSVTSAADIQLNSLGIEQDIYNIQRECEEKDSTIKELTAAVHAADVAGSKRILELEDIIRRKNMIITKLKKDMVVLEQKVVDLVRLRRPSSASTVNTQKLPVMADNLVYDMDSTTSQSSSDSDSDLKNQPQISVLQNDNKISSNENDFAGRSQRVASVNASFSFPRTADRPPKFRSISPLKENTINQRPNSNVTLRPKQLVSPHSDLRRNRRRIQHGSKEATPLKRWA